MKKNIKLFTTVLAVALFAAASACLSSCKNIRDKFDEDIDLVVNMHEDIANGNHYAELTWDGGYESYEVYRYYSSETRGSSYLYHHGDKLAETDEEAYFDHSSDLYSWYENKYVYYWIEDRYGNTSNIVCLHR